MLKQRDLGQNWLGLGAGSFVGSRVAVVGHRMVEFCYFFHIGACQPPARQAASDWTPRRAMLSWNCVFV